MPFAPRRCPLREGQVPVPIIARSGAPLGGRRVRPTSLLASERYPKEAGQRKGFGGYGEGGGCSSMTVSGS